MPNNERTIVGIDVGTHKVCAIVAEADAVAGNRLNVLGVGVVASEGIYKGMITDIVKASRAISHALEAAERQSGCRILSAYVSLSGNHISSVNSKGLVAVSHPDRIIWEDDVNRAIEAARATVAMPAGREALHVIPRTYIVDGQDGIRNPVGLSGFRLDVETHIVMGASNVRESLIRCVQQAAVEVDDLVLSPLASAEATLTEQEKNLGVALVDIGHGTTDIAIYAEGSVWYSKVIPIGGWQLTKDLTIVFNIPYEAAEALKIQYGQAVVPGTIHHPRPVAQSTNGNGKSHPHTYAPLHAAGMPMAAEYDPSSNMGFSSSSQADELIETRAFTDTTLTIRRDDLNAVMASRLDQLFGMISDEIRRSGYEGLLPAGVVLTGGVATMPGIEPLASHRLRMPVRIGRPRRIGGLADSFESPAYATSVGLILWGTKQNAHPPAGLPGRPGYSRGTQEHQSGLAKWLRRFLPSG